MAARDETRGAGRERGERFLALLAPILPALEGYARRALHAPGEAEDVVQSALVTAFRDFGRFAEGTSFRAFVFTYLVGEVRNANRRRRPEPLGDAAAEAAAAEAEDVLAALERESAYDALLAGPERVLDHVGDGLARAVRDLPGHERSALLLRAIGELTYAEIAAALGVPVGTVMSRLFRGRAALRQALAGRAAAPREAGPHGGAPPRPPSGQGGGERP